MPENLDLDTVIEDSLNDSITPETPVDDAPADDITVDSPAADDAVAETPAEDGQVATPATATEPDEATDEFAKKFGLQAQGITGRENRIPYSRVKKIVTKAEKDAEARVRKELDGVSAPKLVEYEAKVKDYEDRLERVGQFEHILENDPKTFLGMLAKVPVYKEFFDFVSQAAAAQAQTQPQPDPSADMPQPDQTLADGSKVYSMDGLKALMNWQANQVEQRTIKQVQDRYAPIEQAWQSQEQMNQMVPVVEKQIAEARTWDRFAELEPKVIEILKGDRNISLEKAYFKAYQANIVPQMTADRNKIRSEVLEELKKRPVASSAPSGSGIKPASRTPATNRTLDDVITSSIEDAGLKIG